MYIQYDGYAWYIQDIPCIYHVYVGHLHIHGIYQAYSRHIPKIGVPDEGIVVIKAA